MNKKIYYKHGIEHRIVDMEIPVEQEDECSLIELVKWMFSAVKTFLTSKS